MSASENRETLLYIKDAVSDLQPQNINGGDGRTSKPAPSVNSRSPPPGAGEESRKPQASKPTRTSQERRMHTYPRDTTETAKGNEGRGEQATHYSGFIVAGTAKQVCTTTAPDPRTRRPDLHATQQETGEHGGPDDEGHRGAGGISRRSAAGDDSGKARQGQGHALLRGNGGVCVRLSGMRESAIVFCPPY